MKNDEKINNAHEMNAMVNGTAQFNLIADILLSTP